MNQHRNLLTAIGLSFALVACSPSGGNTPAPTDTTAPTVSLGASSTNVTAAGNITLTATASDNVGVTKVEFFDGATKLGEDTTAGDGFTQTVTLNSSKNGSRSYTAKAFDAAGNTTTSAARAVTVNIPSDNIPPTVVSSVALSNTSVRITFSEAVSGAGSPAVFSILPTLNVTAATVASDALSVTLTTAAQTASQVYTVSIASSLTDLSGNPINLAGSAASTRNFTGVAAPVADTTGPRLLSANATNANTVRLVFNEAIVGGNVSTNFRITIDLTTNLSVTGASVSVDGTTVTLTTAPQTANQPYLVLPPTITDVAGNTFDTAGTNQFAFSFNGFVP